ncbi:LacI family DNA-binding transcriptional regulator [Oceanobacillus halophilus]|uniref:LacI family transcriptional regulator n=1 Tax=Oceanobacillus halophilus TaxID=930130 RepID=A0A494ZZU5_9BACI|nr:LacI family DNA-binding transcriptional regulator [Oceanobacillus halophilus]RKQ32510.1 LacI family transcriptional regulator [Oceanobacillus halophilus]
MTESKGLTINDVARKCGLSRSTVSRVINNHPYVAKEKKEAVLKAMEELGYKPNSVAQQLRSNKTHAIAVLVPRITNPFYSRLIEKMETEASLLGYQIIICQTRYSKEREVDYLDMLRSRKVDGVILTSIQNDWKDIETYLQYGPIVMCNEFDDQATIPSIRVNQMDGSYLGTKHLIEQGHKKIAYCKGGTKSNIGKKRREGFNKALKEYNLSSVNDVVLTNAFSIEDGKRIFHELPEDITAVFTGGDEVAVGIIFEARENRVKIPEQLAVIGFDNQVISELINPSITTINQPIEEVASKTMEVMIQKLESDKPSNIKEIYEFPVKLIVRQSTVLE